MKKIIFLFFTRADYGKLKKIIISTQALKNFETHVFVTGMHNIKSYGNTYKQIEVDKIKNVTRFFNQSLGDNHSKVLSKTAAGFSKYIEAIKPDLVVVHGDRVEPLTCSIVCCLNNIKIAHFEGGEISGTIDETFRHSISKLCNIHFVTNFVAKKRLIQMGEKRDNIFITGSPDVDLMLSKELPTLHDTKLRYDINFKSYALAIFHPVTTDIKNLKKNILNFIKALKLSNEKYVLIFPNNDLGSELIIRQYKKIKNKKIKIFPSLRFESYLTLLKNSKFIIGNSSSGIMEAPYFGTPTINIGDRQNNRAKLKSIFNCDYDFNVILRIIDKCKNKKKYKTQFYFGSGKSNQKIMNILKSKSIWKIKNQKQFKEINHKI